MVIRVFNLRIIVFFFFCKFCKLNLSTSTDVVYVVTTFCLAFIHVVIIQKDQKPHSQVQSIEICKID